MQPQLSLLLLAAFLGACTADRLAAPSGAETFATHCASCHGPRGEGDGPVAAVMRVPNLRTLSQRNGGEFPADAVASYVDGRRLPDAHGERNMPVWGEVFETTERLVPGADTAPSRVAAIVGYLRELQQP